MKRGFASYPNDVLSRESIKKTGYSKNNDSVWHTSKEIIAYPVQKIIHQILFQIRNFTKFSSNKLYKLSQSCYAAFTKPLCQQSLQKG